MDGQININFPKDFQSAHEGYFLEILFQGYQLMLSERLYDIDWEEDSFTAHYIYQMGKVPLRQEYQIAISAQPPLYDSRHIFDGVKAQKAPRIDMRLTRWFGMEEIHYYPEAKNLSEKNWVKKKGSHINATDNQERYIDTGIRHFISGYYPSNGCVVGYVVNGHTQNIVQCINQIIKKKNWNPQIGFIEKGTTPQYKELFTSTNQLEKGDFILKHLFLQLYTQEHRRNDEINKLINQQKKKLEKASFGQKSRIEQQISLLESVKNEKFQGEAGVLRINLAWNTTDDLDLHVETEVGEIYYRHKELGFGKLDIDANANEPFTNNPQENIVFTQMPSGKCKVKVHFYKNRENKEVDFVLSILTPNDDIKVFLKTVTEKPMIEIADFEFLNGILKIY